VADVPEEQRQRRSAGRRVAAGQGIEPEHRDGAVDDALRIGPHHHLPVGLSKTAVDVESRFREAEADGDRRQSASRGGDQPRQVLLQGADVFSIAGQGSALQYRRTAVGVRGADEHALRLYGPLLGQQATDALYLLIAQGDDVDGDQGDTPARLAGAVVEHQRCRHQVVVYALGGVAGGRHSPPATCFPPAA